MTPSSLSFALLVLLPVLGTSACKGTSSNSGRPVAPETPAATRQDSRPPAYPRQLVEPIVQALRNVPILHLAETAAVCERLVGAPLTAAGKRFVVTRCGATLIAHGHDPLWHIAWHVTAAWTASAGVTVCATFDGRVDAANPQVAYRSGPTLSENEILALVLFEGGQADSCAPAMSPSSPPCNSQPVSE